MTKPLLGLLNQSRLANQIQPIKQTMGMLKASGNPQMMLQQMLSQNPQFKQVQELIQQSGGDPQKAFYSLAEKMGVNPDEVLSALK